MISIYKFKPKFQKALTPLLSYLHSKKITANQITITSIVLSVIIGFLFWNADQIHFLYLALPVGLLIRMALNALDGMMARIYKQQTKKGELLNELGDVISDLLIFFPLLKHEINHLYLVALFIALSIINEFAGLLGKVISGERRYEGPMGKSDRALVISLYGLLCFFSVDLENVSFYIFIILNILLIVSTYSRISKSLK